MRKQLYLQEARKARVPIEPSMNEQCAVFLVRYVVLGIEKRKLKTTEKISAVYLWWDMERRLWDRRTRKHVSRGVYNGKTLFSCYNPVQSVA